MDDDVRLEKIAAGLIMGFLTILSIILIWSAVAVNKELDTWHTKTILGLYFGGYFLIFIKFYGYAWGRLKKLYSINS